MASPVLRERNVSIAGVRTPVLEGGGDGPEAVVFVHGNPGSSGDWPALAAPVSQLARVFAPDMPGFGRADKPADFEYTIEGYARHLERLLDEAGIRRAHLVLHDFGGQWGLTWAAAHPEACRSVVLIDTGVLPGYRWHYLARIWRTPGLGEAFQLATTRFAFRTLLKHGNPRGLPPEFVNAMYENYDAGTRRAVLRLYRATPDLGELAASLTARLAPLADRPALIVWGRHDPYLDAGYAEQQRKVFPAADVRVLEGSGHWPHVDHPGAVVADLLPFLGRQLRPS